ncbi:hypothetical protein [Halomarina oriensis]|uniref:Uncharacterized protein n=1 Tax=Halomarina oriensis TaxID=671145 RepID=A0A6B0GJA2_9EURY|nr:hypothetical protein [Halomarina oriensis]MWG34912.1 hypothetical protein [Halomarina oriensis]
MGSTVTRASILDSLHRPVTVRAKLAGEDWHERDFSESHADTPCIVVSVRISDAGDVDFLTTTGYECESTPTPTDS